MPPKPASPSSAGGGQQVDLSSLDSQTLLSIKRQLDAELTTLNTSFTSLRSATSRFTSCLSTLSSGLSTRTAGTPLLVPMTTSLYVPGKLASNDTVMVDVGTGFYVEKSVAEAKTFYEGKVGELNGNLKDLEKILNGKSQNLRIVEEVLRQKMASEQQQGPQGQGQASAVAAAAG
jgi:prefoldin alpha subunit